VLYIDAVRWVEFKHIKGWVRIWGNEETHFVSGTSPNVSKYRQMGRCRSL